MNDLIKCLEQIKELDEKIKTLEENVNALQKEINFLTCKHEDRIRYPKLGG